LYCGAISDPGSSTKTGVLPFSKGRALHDENAVAAWAFCPESRPAPTTPTFGHCRDPTLHSCVELRATTHSLPPPLSSSSSGYHRRHPPRRLCPPPAAVAGQFPILDLLLKAASCCPRPEHNLGCSFRDVLNGQAWRTRFLAQVKEGAAPNVFGFTRDARAAVRRGIQGFSRSWAAVEHNLGCSFSVIVFCCFLFYLVFFFLIYFLFS
jgi:hypothetical protein